MFINKEASKKLHCQVPPLPTCIALLISHSKALFESLHIWHLHIFFFTFFNFFFTTTLLVANLSSSPSYSVKIGPNWCCFGQFLSQLWGISLNFGRFWPVLARIGPNWCKSVMKKRKKKKKRSGELTRRNESGAGVVALEPHPCFLELKLITGLPL